MCSCCAMHNQINPGSINTCVYPGMSEYQNWSNLPIQLSTNCGQKSNHITYRLLILALLDQIYRYGLFSDLYLQATEISLLDQIWPIFNIYSYLQTTDISTFGPNMHLHYL